MRPYPAIIVDIDGTLALRTGDRSPFDWGRVGEDVLNPPVVDLVRMIHGARRHEIILMSGRDEVCRTETQEWLIKYRIPFNRLYMRPTGNNEKDSVVKERLYREHIESQIEVEFVLDDRDQVVKMWRSIGLTVFQVAEGDF